MRKMFFNTILIIFIVVSAVSTTWATNLRGKVLAYNSYYNSYYPAAGIQIVFVKWNGTRWNQVASTSTQRDGMYYSNLKPGNYYIQAPGVNLPVTVHNTETQDLPQITINK